MAIYPPPNWTEPIPIFNPINWEIDDSVITIEYLNANYLKFPVAQGLETFQETITNGNATFNNPLFINENITMEQGLPLRSITWSDGTVQNTAPIPNAPSGVVAGAYTNTNLTVDTYGIITSASNGTAGIPLTPTIVAGTTNFGVAGQIQFNQYGQLTSTTNGLLAPDPTGTYTNATVSVNIYGQVTSASSGITPPPSASNTVPFFSSSGVFPAGASNQSLSGGGLLTLQPQILFDAGALTDFDDNTAVTIKFSTSIAFGGASGYYQVGTQISGMIDFYPKRAVFDPLNVAGVYNSYLLNNEANSTAGSNDFGNIDRKCWAYDINEISGIPEMAGNNVYLQINKGVTGQVIVGLFVTGQTYPYVTASSPNAIMRVSHSVALVNQGIPNPNFPVKLTIPYLPPLPAIEVVWSDDPTNLYTAVNGELVYGGFELGTYVP